MLRQFYMNGDLWRVQFVSPHDSMLIDRTGQRTLGVAKDVLGNQFTYVSPVGVEKMIA